MFPILGMDVIHVSTYSLVKISWPSVLINIDEDDDLQMDGRDPKGRAIGHFYPALDKR